MSAKYNKQVALVQPLIKIGRVSLIIAEDPTANIYWS